MSHVRTIFRHSACQTPFGERHPQGQDADVEALPEFEDWVMKEWERIEYMVND